MTVDVTVSKEVHSIAMQQISAALGHYVTTVPVFGICALMAM